jgi:hypothetical protein
MSTNPPAVQVYGKRTAIIVDGNNIEFEFARVNRSKEYDDILIQIFNKELYEEYGKPNGALFIRDNIIYSYYKTNDPEYIKIVDAIASVVASAYNMKVVTTLGEVK